MTPTSTNNGERAKLSPELSHESDYGTTTGGTRLKIYKIPVHVSYSGILPGTRYL